MRLATCVLLAVYACLVAGGCSRPASTPSSEPERAAEPAAPPAALDLSREHISELVSEPNDALIEPEPALPNMFDTPDQPRVQLDGRLITDKASQDLIDKVDGAEVTIEIPTR